MRVMGLIGGMSWNSTLEYYRIINELFAQGLGGFHSARLILYSLDFDEIEKAQREGRWDEGARILVEASRALKRAGADLLVICTNTMHKVADVAAERVGLPLLHIVDVAGNAIRERGLHRVGLLGTWFVMKENFYQERLCRLFGIDVLVPGEDEIVAINRIIYDELCRGMPRASSRRTCVDTISRLVTRGAEGIVVGCTELPLFIRSGEIEVPVFDTTRLYAEAAVDLALAEGWESAPIGTSL